MLRYTDFSILVENRLIVFSMNRPSCCFSIDRRVVEFLAIPILGNSGHHFGSCCYRQSVVPTIGDANYRQPVHLHSGVRQGLGCDRTTQNSGEWRCAPGVSRTKPAGTTGIRQTF
jgi:hypothetical protein